MTKAMRSKQQIAGIAYRDQGQDICVTSFRYLHGYTVTYYYVHLVECI
jgi:hypothetical protein